MLICFHGYLDARLELPLLADSGMFLSTGIIFSFRRYICFSCYYYSTYVKSCQVLHINICRAKIYYQLHQLY